MTRHYIPLALTVLSTVALLALLARWSVEKCYGL